MSGSESDETRLLLDRTQNPSSSSNNIPDSIRPIDFLTSSQGASGGSSNDTFVKEMDTTEKATSPLRPTNYGYLEHIQSLKSSFTPKEKVLSKKVRAYNASQLKLITCIEDILAPSDESKDHATAFEKQFQRHIEILTMVTLIANSILFIIKIVVVVMSKSLSVISSLVDSGVDLLTSLILLWADRKIKIRDAYNYPGGRARLEPIAIVILSVIMCAASVIVIYESVDTINQDIGYFTHPNDTSSKYTLPDIDMTTIPVVVMIVTIVSKTILFVLCYRIKTPTMHALAEDHRNDVASNSMALVCGLIASEALRGKIKLEAIVIDPIGAIIIAVYIITAWILQANRQVRRLTGISAEPHFLQELTHVVYNYRPDIVTKIDSIEAVHHGTNFFVEVHIGLPGSMPLAEAHDIGAELQARLERINIIERAFVHLDYEFSHMPPDEHKVI